MALFYFRLSLVILVLTGIFIEVVYSLHSKYSSASPKPFSKGPLVFSQLRTSLRIIFNYSYFAKNRFGNYYTAIPFAEITGGGGGGGGGGHGKDDWIPDLFDRSNELKKLKFSTTI